MALEVVLRYWKLFIFIFSKKKFHILSFFHAFSQYLTFLSFSFIDKKIVFTDTAIAKNNNNTILPNIMDGDGQSDSRDCRRSRLMNQMPSAG